VHRAADVRLAEFDAAADDPEIEAMDQAAIAALLAKIPQARPRLLFLRCLAKRLMMRDLGRACAGQLRSDFLKGTAASGNPEPSR
jgi:hypothetical protein